MIVVAVDTTPWVPAVPTTDQHLLLVLPQPSVLQSRLLSSLSFRLFIVLPPLPPSTPQLLLFISPQTLYSYIRLSEDGLPGVLWFFGGGGGGGEGLQQLTSSPPPPPPAHTSGGVIRKTHSFAGTTATPSPPLASRCNALIQRNKLAAMSL